jgi:hypothetical protein
MKRLGFLVLAITAIGAGCDDDNGVSPSTQPMVFSGLLSPANENPPISNVENSGSGAAQVTILATRDASGRITAATANMYFQLYGFPGDTRAQAAHIHNGPAGVNGPVRIDTGLTPATARELEGGGVELTFTGLFVAPADAEAIDANPSAWYFNVHSPRNPGGFARGQLVRVQ